MCDNGSGFDVEKPGEKAGHAGLKIMEERAIELGGHLAIKSGKDGTNVSLILPIGVF